MHESQKSGLTESADGSMAEDTESLRSTARSSHVGLTNGAFSWKFVCTSSCTKRRHTVARMAPEAHCVLCGHARSHSSSLRSAKGRWTARRGILQRPPLSPSPSGSLAWIMCRVRRAEMLSPSTREASAGL
jgi:hypothetical protein